MNDAGELEEPDRKLTVIVCGPPGSTPVPNSVAVMKLRTYEAPGVRPVIVVDQSALPVAVDPPPNVTNWFPAPAVVTLPLLSA